MMNTLVISITLASLLFALIIAQHGLYEEPGPYTIVPRRVTQFRSKTSESGETITILNWNILASHLCTRGAFPFIDSRFCNWSRRSPAILRQILDYSPDFCALQEVEYFSSWLSPSMREHGYEGLFQHRRIWSEGVALFYKPNKWILVSQRGGQLTAGLAPFLFVKFVPNATENGVQVRNQQPIYMIVVQFQKIADDAQRFLQVEEVIKLFKQFYIEQEAGGDLYRASIITCMDLGAEPESSAWIRLGNDSDMHIRSLYESELKSDALERHYTHYKRGSFTSNGNKNDNGDIHRISDYIFATRDFKVEALLESPSLINFPHTRLPAANHPSDHIPLFAQLHRIPHLLPPDPLSI